MIAIQWQVNGCCIDLYCGVAIVVQLLVPVLFLCIVVCHYHLFGGFVKYYSVGNALNWVF